MFLCGCAGLGCFGCCVFGDFVQLFGVFFFMAIWVVCFGFPIWCFSFVLRFVVQVVCACFGACFYCLILVCWLIFWCVLCCWYVNSLCG